jgi:hypothetical protein
MPLPHVHRYNNKEIKVSELYVFAYVLSNWLFVASFQTEWQTVQNTMPFLSVSKIWSNL